MGAQSAEEAIAFIDGGIQPDLIFTDVRLAGLLTGWDVAEAFRREHGDIPLRHRRGARGRA